jgi:putative transposase
MPRRLRFASGGYVYHVLNRAVGRAKLFNKQGDYAAFEKVLRQAHDFVPMRLLAYCALPNHWHLLLWPQRDGELSEYLRWLTVTHTQRWHAHHHTSGTGPLYQGRFKSFPVAADDHCYTVGRYVERNALRAGLVPQAEKWRWSSLWHRWQQSEGLLLADWPLPVPADWIAYVNGVETEGELEALRRCVLRGAPYGASRWQRQTAKRLGLEASLRARGRPRQSPPIDR